MLKRLAALAVAALHPTILGGTASDNAQDSTVFLFHLHDPPDRGNTCTGTLVAPRLVLTAHHCVADVTEGAVGCTALGVLVTTGGKIKGNNDPRSLFVFTGKDRAPFTLQTSGVRDLDPSKWQPSSRGLQIFDDGAKDLCGHDLALLVLDAPITNVPIAKLRLETDVEVGEAITAVGYGVSLDEREPIRRQQRTTPIRKSGPNDGYPLLTENEFDFAESICEGDSGGPLFATSGAVVGVISRGTNGVDPDRERPAITCPQADNTGTKLRPFHALIADAFNAAGASPRLEGWDAGGCR